MLSDAAYRTIIVITLLTLLAIGDLQASTATVQVSARVLPWIKMEVSQHKSNYRIEEKNLQMSYIDLPRSSTVQIRSNVKSLVLELNNNGTEKILASLSGSNNFSERLYIELTDEEIASHSIKRNLDFRVLIDENTTLGTHNLSSGISVLAY